MNYCAGCPRRSKNYIGLSGAVGTAGDASSARMCIVGMSPGRDELRLGEPFVGASGALLWSIGKEVGLFRPDCFIFNTSSCWPCGAKGKTLSREQVEACSTRFASDLMSFRGQVILALGVDAFEAVTGLISWESRTQKALKDENPEHFRKPSGINSWRGYLVRPSDCAPVVASREIKGDTLYRVGGKCPVCKGTGGEPDGDMPWNYCWYCGGTGKRKKGDAKLKTVYYDAPRLLPPNTQYIIGAYHPSYVMRTGKKVLGAFINDLGRAMDAIRGELDIVQVEYSTVMPDVASFSKPADANVFPPRTPTMKL